MTIKLGINHDLRSVDGSFIMMPPWFQGALGWANLKRPNVYDTDDAIALYPEGTKFVEGDRTWFYARFRGGIETPYTSYTQASGTDLQGICLFTGAIQQDYTNALLVRKVADEQSMWYTDTTSEARSTDYYSGGWVVGKDTITNHRAFYRRIVAHNYKALGTAAEPTGVGTTWDASAYDLLSELQVDQPFSLSKTSLVTSIMPNRYKHAASHRSNANAHYDGMPIGACMQNNPTYDHWVWCQTNGPLGTIAIVNAFAGAGEVEVKYYVMGDGGYQAVQDNQDTTYDLTERPLAGYGMASTRFESGTPQDEGVPMIFLTMRR